MAATFNAPVPLLCIEVIVPDESATTPYTATRGFRIIDAWTIKSGANGGVTTTLSIGTGGGIIIVTAIVLGNVDAVDRAASISSVTNIVASGGGIQTVSAQGGQNAECRAYIKCIPA